MIEESFQIIAFKCAVSMLVSGASLNGKIELERVPSILREIALDYEKEIKNQKEK